MKIVYHSISIQLYKNGLEMTELNENEDEEDNGFMMDQPSDESSSEEEVNLDEI